MNSKNMYLPDYVVMGLGLLAYYYFPSLDIILGYFAISYTVAFQAILFYRMYRHRDSIMHKISYFPKVEYWYIGFISLCYFCLNIGPWSHIWNFKWEPGEGAFSLLFMGLGLQALRFLYDELMEDDQNQQRKVQDPSNDHSYDSAA